MKKTARKPVPKKMGRLWKLPNGLALVENHYGNARWYHVPANFDPDQHDYLMKMPDPDARCPLGPEKGRCKDCAAGLHPMVVPAGSSGALIVDFRLCPDTCRRHRAEKQKFKDAQRKKEASRG